MQDSNDDNVTILIKEILEIHTEIFTDKIIRIWNLH